MPEILEVESYRRQAEMTVGRRVIGVDAPDPWYLKNGLTVGALSDAVIPRKKPAVAAPARWIRS